MAPALLELGNGWTGESEVSGSGLVSCSRSDSLDQIPNNVAHATEGRMAPWRGRHRGKTKRKRHKKRSKLKIQPVAAGRRGPRTPEQESCTPIPVQVRILPPSLGPPGTPAGSWLLWAECAAGRASFLLSSSLFSSRRMSHTKTLSTQTLFGLQNSPRPWSMIHCPLRNQSKFCPHSTPPPHGANTKQNCTS